MLLIIVIMRSKCLTKPMSTMCNIILSHTIDDRSLLCAMLTRSEANREPPLACWLFLLKGFMYIDIQDYLTC